MKILGPPESEPPGEDCRCPCPTLSKAPVIEPRDMHNLLSDLKHTKVCHPSFKGKFLISQDKGNTSEEWKYDTGRAQFQIVKRYQHVYTGVVEQRQKLSPGEGNRDGS